MFEWLQKNVGLRKVRDLTVMDLNGQEILVVACDSVGGIGSKPHKTGCKWPER